MAEGCSSLILQLTLEDKFLMNEYLWIYGKSCFEEEEKIAKDSITEFVYRN